MSFRWDPEAGRFRDESGAFVSARKVVKDGNVTREGERFRLNGRFIPSDALPKGEEQLTTPKGEVIDANTAIRQGRVTRDEHGFRLDGRFISPDDLRQGETVRGPIGQQEEAERLVIVKDDGTVVLIRAGGSKSTKDSVTDTPEEILASGVASEALKEGIITEGEYEQLGRMNTLRLVREMAVVRQDLTQV